MIVSTMANTKQVRKALRLACKTLGVRVTGTWTDQENGWGFPRSSKRYVVFACGNADNASKVVMLTRKIFAREGYSNDLWQRKNNPNFITCVSYLESTKNG